MNETRCECGAGFKMHGDVLEVRPHDAGCPRLRAMFEKEQQGERPSCGSLLITEREGQVVYCPKGCMRNMKGEAALEVFDAAGSGWIRDAIEDEVLDAEIIN